MRVRLRIVVSACVGLLAVVVGLLSPSHAATDPGPYVALGDSFSAGSGVLPVDPKANPACARSLLNYPHVIAAATGASLTDVTCGGAQTSHFYTAQYRDVPPQLDALRPDTKLVTLSMGGNDNGTFINAIISCGAAGLLTLGTGSPCKDRYGTTFVDEVENITYPRVKQALIDIQSRSPLARIAVVGYPWLLPPTKGCYLKMPVARGDVPYLRDLQAHLNGIMERAAGETGATFVDMSVVSEGHDACAPASKRWVEPVLGTVRLSVVHPNRRGEQKMAEQAIAVLGL